MGFKQPLSSQIRAPLKANIIGISARTNVTPLNFPNLRNTAHSLARGAKQIGRQIIYGRDPFRIHLHDGYPTLPPYHAQYGQDRIFHTQLFGDLKKGVFVDIGAHDGVSFSNTLYFEKSHQWRGLCVEPIPEVFEKLVANRVAICVQACVASVPGNRKFLRVKGYAEMLSGMVDSYDPRHILRIEHEIRQEGGSAETIEVKGVRLDDLFIEHHIEGIDLLSVDVEGGELDVLASFDLSKVRPKVICIENNYADRRIWKFLRRFDYKPYARIRQDEIYLAREFSPRA